MFFINEGGLGSMKQVFEKPTATQDKEIENIFLHSQGLVILWSLQAQGTEEFSPSHLLILST